MWTVEQRQADDRAGLRYPSDLTDTEWALVASFIPPARRGGRKPTADVRQKRRLLHGSAALGSGTLSDRVACGSA
jgi:hypothetical protein